MAVRSVSFDDESDDDLSVFSGHDLLISHYDIADLDWREVAERSALDERRGLVITQVAVLEDLVDEFILYLEDPIDLERLQADLDRLTIGPRVDRLERRLAKASILGAEAIAALAHVRRVVDRRNELAHGTIQVRPVGGSIVLPLPGDLVIEWVITSRRSRTIERITMAGLRQDLDDSIACFSSLLRYAERFVESAPAPRNYCGGRYLTTPTP